MTLENTYSQDFTVDAVDQALDSAFSVMGTLEHSYGDLFAEGGSTEAKNAGRIAIYQIVQRAVGSGFDDELLTAAASRLRSMGRAAARMQRFITVAEGWLENLSEVDEVDASSHDELSTVNLHVYSE